MILSGAAAGKSVPIASVDGQTVGFAFAVDHSVLNAIRPGDRVRIDNAWALALQTYQRHQVPTPDLYGWNQYRDGDGEPIYPQRENLIGPIAAAGTAGSVPNGQINGKMLVLEALMDIDAMPWQADWYRSKVREALGPDFEDHFALWFIDHAQHDNPLTAAARARTVSYEGALQQALRDLSAWVEKGIKPAATRYSIVDAQVDSSRQRTRPRRRFSRSSRCGPTAASAPKSRSARPSRSPPRSRCRPARARWSRPNGISKASAAIRSMRGIDTPESAPQSVGDICLREARHVLSRASRHLAATR